MTGRKSQRVAGHSRRAAVCPLIVVLLTSITASLPAAPAGARPVAREALSASLSPSQAVSQGMAGPADCALPGLDDRCETWAAVYDDPSLWKVEAFDARDELLDMALSPTGKTVFTLGEVRGGFPPIHQYRIVAHRSGSGDQLWVSGIPFLPSTGLAVSHDGARVYVAGYTRGNPPRPGDGDPLANQDVIITALDAATGRRLWRRTFGGTVTGDRAGDPHDLHSIDEAKDLVASPVNDRIYITGVIEGRDGFDNVLAVAYKGATGQRRWVSSSDSSSADSPYRLDWGRLAGVSPDGKLLLVTGQSCPYREPKFGQGSLTCDYTLAAYQAHNPKNVSTEGKFRWRAVIGGGDVFSVPLDLAIGGSRVFLTGFRPGPGGDQWGPWVTAAYDLATGDRAWSTRHVIPLGPPAPIVPNTVVPTVRWRSVAAAPKGDRVFVTGEFAQAARGDYITAAYDAATGKQEWVAQFGLPNSSQGLGPDHETSRAVAVSPNGKRVYITGERAGLPDVFTEWIAGNPLDAWGAVDAGQVTVAYEAATGVQKWAAGYQRPPCLPQLQCPFGELGLFVEVARDGTVVTAGRLRSQLVRPAAPVVGSRNVEDWGIQGYEY